MFLRLQLPIGSDALLSTIKTTTLHCNKHKWQGRIKTKNWRSTKKLFASCNRGQNDMIWYIISTMIVTNTKSLCVFQVLKVIVIDKSTPFICPLGDVTRICLTTAIPRPLYWNKKVVESHKSIGCHHGSYIFQGTENSEHNLWPMDVFREWVRVEAVLDLSFTCHNFSVHFITCSRIN